MKNLFVWAHELKYGNIEGKIGSGWEDDLTEMLAVYFAVDGDAANQWVGKVIGNSEDLVAEIETQFQVGGDRPDMVFHLVSGGMFAQENKVGDDLQQCQLQRYLKLKAQNGEPSHVALVSMKSIECPEDVLQNPMYHHPSGSSHYFWQDLYRAVIAAPECEPGLARYRRSFLDYLDMLGFAPSSLSGSWNRLYADRTIPENQRVQEEFFRKLESVRTHLKGLGLKVTKVAHSGVQAAMAPEQPLQHVILRPARARRDHLPAVYGNKINTEVVMIGLVYEDSVSPDTLNDIFKQADKPFTTPNGYQWWPVQPYSFSKNRLRIEFISNLSDYLSDDAHIQERLGASCIAMIDWLVRAVPALKSGSGRSRP